MIRAYFNQQADTWDEMVAEKDTAKLQEMAKRLNLKPGFTVLDVGTGTGVFLPYILAEIGKQGRVIALDLADEMLIRAKAKDFDGNTDYLCADVMEIPLVAERFDAVICYSSFPHFQDKPKALAEIHRVLKNGGSLSICHTSSRTEINHIHRQIPIVSNDIIPDVDRMRLMLLSAGFAEIRVEDGRDSYLATAIRPG